jgi:glyoxylase-like metal-dependent hydrolase (beta-lactamase superfamily II)
VTLAPYEIVLPGVPVASRRGALGWCSVVLLRRPGRTVLFDTGSFGDRRLLLDRLAELGVPTGKIDLVFGSHFHFDHVANAELLDCPLALSAPEWRYAEEGGYVAANDPFVPRALIPFVRERIVTFTDWEEVLPGVRTVLLPGHTPGTCGLLLVDDGVLLASDAVKNAWDFERGEPPPSFFSRERAAPNYRRIRDLASIIVPGHDRAFEIGDDGSPRYLKGSAIDLELYGDPRSPPRQLRLTEETYD